MDCIFCKIVKGEIPSVKIYEDDDVLSFMDIKPFSRGHCLVIPKSHAENIFDIKEEMLQKIILVTKKLSEKIKEKIQADGIRLAQSNGKAAGQEVMHFHLHVIPRYEKDKIFMSETITADSSQANLEELKKVAEKINS